MSKKREPMLSDEYRQLMENSCLDGPSTEGLDAQSRHASGSELFRTGFNRARSAYERLIDEGKLRVVEEVGLDHRHNCKSCGRSNAYEDCMSGTMEDNLNNYCSGCGAKIKRT